MRPPRKVTRRRFGSFAYNKGQIGDVRFTLIGGHAWCPHQCLQGAIARRDLSPAGPDEGIEYPR